MKEHTFTVYYQKGCRDAVLDLFDGRVCQFSVEEDIDSPDLGLGLVISAVLVDKDRENMRKFINSSRVVNSGVLKDGETILEKFKE